jgi:hypothetical protein
MARTMVEDGYRVKPLALPVARATNPPRKARASLWKACAGAGSALPIAGS